MRLRKLFVLCASGLAVPCLADTHIFFDLSGQLTHFDSVARKAIRALPTVACEAAAQDEAGVIWVFAGGDLRTINPATGVETTIAPTVEGTQAMTFREGELFAIRNGGASDDLLIVIDEGTGNGTLVGPCGADGLQALCTAPDGTLFAWDIDEGLMTIDHTTGIATLRGAGNATADLQTMEFDRFGVLWGIGNGKLYRINQGDGSVKALVSGLSDVRGMVIPKTQGRMLCSDGVLFGSIDLATGFKISHGPQIGASMASRADGTLWGHHINRLRRLNPGSGASTIIGNSVNAIIATTTIGNTIYGIMNTANQPLVTIDEATGVLTTLGNTGRPINSITTMTTAPDGTLFAYDVSLGLVTINPLSGSVTDVSDRFGPDARISAIEFGRDGRLYGGRNELFLLNPALGGTIGTIGGNAYTNLSALGAMPANGFVMGARVGSEGGTYVVDLLTATATPLGTSIGLGGLTRSPEGSIFGLAPSAVLSMDRATGNQGSTFLTLPQGLHSSIVFGDDDRLIAGNTINNINTFESFERLAYTTSTIVPMPDVPLFIDLCATPDGTVFGMATAGGLHQLDPILGTFTALDPTPPTGSYGGIIFHPDGRLFATSGGNLFEIDPLNGDRTSIGSLGFNVGGLVFSPPVTFGTIILGDYVAPSNSQVVEVTVRHPGTTVDIETHRPRVAPNGTVSFASQLFGTYDITIKGSHWLRRRIPNVTLATGSAVYLNFLLTNGDVDGDNEVTIGDYAQLSSAFGSVPGDANWDPNADLDGDEEVGIGDYAILSTNFGETGDD